MRQAEKFNRHSIVKLFPLMVSKAYRLIYSTVIFYLRSHIL